jgi:lipopolysaccharide biosynthesis protein
VGRAVAEALTRVALFAHFDVESRVRPYVLHHLAELRRVCGRIVFLSSSPLDRDARAQLAPHCDDVRLCENTGFDFAMWSSAIAQLGECDELVLTNSSLFGPLRPLAGVFAEMDARECEVWGITENYDHSWHLQSYFLVFKKAALRAPAFARFWSSVLPYRDKQTVIRAYEVGLSQFLVENGLKLEALVPHARLWLTGASEYMRPLYRGLGNLTCLAPMQLLQHGMPYIKVELLRDNPARVDLKPVWRAIDTAGYDRALIEFDRATSRCTR